MTNVFLIGYRCTGKTSAGKSLAAGLGWAFTDADRVIADEIGCSIAEFIAASGWAAFREKERRIIDRLSRSDKQVVAAGGGAVTTAANVDRMRAAGRVIWLKASPDTIRRRMRADAATMADRPSLTGQGSLEEVEAVLAQRTPLYQEAAHHCIDTDRLGTAEVVEKITALIRSHLATCPTHTTG
jgi:shikimate kinase